MRNGPWSGFERAAFDTCEPDVAGWLTHPGETVSALAYVIAAAVAWRISRPLAAGRPARRLPAVLAVVGGAAVLFHASFAALFQRLDLAAIPLLSPSLPRLAVVLRIWAVFGEWYACNLLSTKDRGLEEWNVVP